jgi:hypothetical protein
MLDEETKERLERMTVPELENRLHELCQSLGTVHPQSISGGREPGVLPVREFEEYEFVKKLLGFRTGLS